jgi:DNA-binding CsgD family transcriptional regulator
LTSLRREKSKLGAAEQADPAPSDKFDQLMDYQRYLRLSDRQKQVADLLRQDPNLKNVEIAEQLGISPARVGQVRRTLT